MNYNNQGHAAIERALFGREWEFFPSWCEIDVEKYWGGYRCASDDNPHWHLSRKFEHPNDDFFTTVGHVFCERPPDFSSSLDLCHCAEMKIAEMGQIPAYLEAMEFSLSASILGSDPLNAYEAFPFITASAEVRVGAMVKVIQELGLTRSPALARNSQSAEVFRQMEKIRKDLPSL